MVEKSTYIISVRQLQHINLK